MAACPLPGPDRKRFPPGTAGLAGLHARAQPPGLADTGSARSRATPVPAPAADDHELPVPRPVAPCGAGRPCRGSGPALRAGQISDRRAVRGRPEPKTRQQPRRALRPQRPAALSGGLRQTSLVRPAVRLGLVRVFMIPASMIGCITLSSATSALAPLQARMAMRC